MKKLEKKTLDEWLDNIDYGVLNSKSYMPTEFALSFMNFIKLVNGEKGEDNKTPPVHLKMLDKLEGDSEYILNLLFRGASKTTVFMEYLTLYIAVFEELPNFGKVGGMIYVSDSIDNGVKNARDNIEYRYENSPFLQEWLPYARFTEKYLEFRNKDGARLGVKLYGAETGIRGSKIFGKRPTLAVLDDLIGEKDAISKATMDRIKDTVYKGVNHAMDPGRRKVIFNGTPFNKSDVIVEAVESGAWDVNVWPICEKFPCEEHEFVGAWEDRFSYKFVKAQYDFAIDNGKPGAFYQELMLRISSEDDRLVKDREIQWYSRPLVLKNKHNFNFYITTDFATSARQTADYSVISVWAYNSNGDWFWVDGVCERTTMDRSINSLFRLVQEYKPQQVGVETSGQQGAFITWLQQEMITRNIWFNFASSSENGTPGIRPIADKLSRFNLTVPWFKMRKMFFPLEMKETPPMKEFVSEIRLTTTSGFKGKDDFIDTISMLGYLKAWRPSEEMVPVSNVENVWEEEYKEEIMGSLNNYIV